MFMLTTMTEFTIAAQDGLNFKSNQIRFIYGNVAHKN